jgi:two-component system cell cycle response regulator
MTANILVVDDLETNIKLLEATLLREYYNVFTATSGQEALDILAKNCIDVVLLDVMMPGMDGLETCRLIKANPMTSHIPVVMVTALSEIKDRVKALEVGADEFLTKPVSEVALLARVNSLARTRSAIDELRLRNKYSKAAILDFENYFVDREILLIDDDLIQAKNINKILTKLTNRVTILSNLNDLDKKLEVCNPDMIIISCQIEFADPLRIGVKLRSINNLRYVSIMLLVEEENISTVIRGLELGVNDYFVYPVDENELLARVKTQLKRKRYQDVLRYDLEESLNLSTKDCLTGILNRRYFDTHIGQIIANSLENKQSFCLLMIDMDNFKCVNDQYGHQAGDEVLKQLTMVLKNSLRSNDLLARYGGEEFVVVLSETMLDAGVNVAERLRSNVELTRFAYTSDSVLSGTISIGVAQYKPLESVRQLVERADAALYKAKDLGRNNVIFAE